MKKYIILTFILLVGITLSFAKGENPKDTVLEKTFSGLKWRSIGPALTSGRIADIAVDPNNHAHYYVAAASGHLWETKDNGTSFKPIFDNHGVYSMGCVTIAPSNTNIIWLGTGENNHQRAIGYGNGVYKSEDGGKTWKNMGLPKSYQIGEIIIHPKNPNIVYVAAEGSIWSSNKERGVYKTTDGGKTWEQVLFISENTGVANISMDANNPEILYAGAEQRQRKQYTKIGGGPESAFYKTIDGGKTWNKLTNGIPGVDKGGMEIVVSPLNSNTVYIMFEASNGKGGIFKSSNAGASFEKMSDYFSSGQYYSELYCDPINEGKIYSIDTYSHLSYDDGKTWKNIGLNQRHVDDHAMWIDPQQTEHFMIAGDGGVYETWNGGSTYIHKTTLPVTQFYRVAVDNSEPFYWVYGGTQDNNSIGGPSQNLRRGGVSTWDWINTLGGDGFWQAIDPTDPNIVYSAYQYGNIYRFDKKSRERLKIKPQPKEDELTFRWNWDAPFVLSKYDNKTLYLAANKLFKSTDRGASWQEISEDLTRNEDRNQFKVMGKYWPSDAVAKDVSTSQWGTIVSLCESPVKQGLVYVGTDDGLIQVTEDDGKTWRKTETFSGVPKYTMISDICASKFDENIVYASFNNMKEGDFKSYLFVSNDKGKSWTSISENLPDSQSVWTIEQDYKNKDLLFTGTEFGIYFTIDAGKSWAKLGSGLPDIEIRDITIQERENDLVIASFGRGFYILDNYSALQDVTKEKLDEKALIFPIRDAKMYIQQDDRYGVGAAYFTAKNPKFGANITYYFKEDLKTAKELRLEKEKELFKKGEKIPQPTKAELDAENEEIAPYLVFTIKNKNGDIVRKLYDNAKKGVHQINWDLKMTSVSPVRIKKDKFDVKKSPSSMFLALPGEYTVEMALVYKGKTEKLTEAVSFKAVTLNNKSIKVEDVLARQEFYNKILKTTKSFAGNKKILESYKTKIEYFKQAFHNTNGDYTAMINKCNDLSKKIKNINYSINGPKVKASWEEVPPEKMPTNVRLNELIEALWESTASPTATQKENLEVLNKEANNLSKDLFEIDLQIKEIEKKLNEINAPYTPGRILKN